MRTRPVSEVIFSLELGMGVFGADYFIGWIDLYLLGLIGGDLPFMLSTIFGQN